MTFRLPLLIVALATPLLAHASENVEPIKHLRMFVFPYYTTADDPTQPPGVGVSRYLDGYLTSSNPKDILIARDIIVANPGRFTPISMVVMSFRMYEVGLRDDAVYWFYVARARYDTIDAVLDLAHPSLSQVKSVMTHFIHLGGQQLMDGYAFCDIAQQQKQERSALEWVEKNPYDALVMPQMPARSGDRSENLKKALAQMWSDLDARQKKLLIPATLQSFMAEREKANAQARYCWK